MRNVVLVGFKRSPFTIANKGLLASVRPEDILSQVINDLIETTNINKTFQPIMGNPFKSPNKNGCEWPIGHPDEQNFHFCDKKKFNDKPYCLEHCAVAYVLPEKEEELNVINQLV